MSHPCDANCGRYFNSIRLKNTHLTSARSCSWYVKARLRDLGNNDAEDGEPLSTLMEPDPQAHQHVEDQEWLEYNPQQDPDIDMGFGPYGDGDGLQFLPAEPIEILDENRPQTAENSIDLRSRHSRHTVLDNDDDECIIMVDEDAGRIFRKEIPPRYTQDREGDTLMEEDREPNPFAPFSSELDWRVAHWAVKDGPGHNAFNRLLKIPGVSNIASFIKPQL
jgi:hypothetical protein